MDNIPLEFLMSVASSQEGFLQYESRIMKAWSRLHQSDRLPLPPL